MLPGALEAGAEHAHRVDLRLGRDRANHAGAGRAVAAEIALQVLLGDRVAVLVERDRRRRRRARRPADGLARRRCRGRRPSRPRPVAPPSAHSRSTRSGRRFSSPIPSTAVRGSDQAGRSSSSIAAPSLPRCRLRRSRRRRLRARSPRRSGATARLIDTRWAAAAGGAAGQHRGRRGVLPELRLGGPARHLGCEQRDVGGGLGDRQRHGRSLLERAAELEVARLRAGAVGLAPLRAPAERFERDGEDVGVERRELRQAAGQGERLRGRARVVGPPRRLRDDGCGDRRDDRGGRACGGRRIAAGQRSEQCSGARTGPRPAPGSRPTRCRAVTLRRL